MLSPGKKLIMRTITFCLCVYALFYAPMVFGQTEPLALTAPNPSSGGPEAPLSITASDGDHDRYILIRWEAVPNARSYRVFRSTKVNSGAMQEITRNWQSSTWFCDYDVQKNVDYYYAVMCSDGRQSSGLSKMDKGFLRKETIDRAGQDESLSDVEGLTAPRPNAVLVAGIATIKSNYKPGDTVNLTINLKNMLDGPAPNSELRIFLSKDVVFDWNDLLLVKKTYGGFPADPDLMLHELFMLPGELLPGNYFCIVVLSLQGDVLNSKSGLTPLRIEP